MLVMNCRYSAQVALDRRDELDVEGWKVGDPYVPLDSVIEKVCLRLLNTLLACPTPLLQSRLHSSRRLRNE